MPDYHRGRARDRDRDGYYYDDDDYYPSPERGRVREHHRPTAQKHRSMSQRAKDKLEDKLEGAMERLGLAESGHSNALVHRRHRSPTPGPGVGSGALVHRRHRSPSSHGDHHRHRSHSHARSHGYSHGGTHRSSSRHHRHHDGVAVGHHDHHHRRRYSTSPQPHRRHHHHSQAYSHRGGDRSRSSSRHRRRSLSNVNWDRSLKSAVDAAAIEAFRLRKEPGAWTSSKKTSRIATAAVSAAAIGAAMDDKKPGKEKKGELGTIGSAIGGLVVNRIVNGPRREGR